MADSIVSLAVDKISSLLVNEAKFISDAKEKFERLQLELKRMQSFLIDADCGRNQDERVRNWIAQIRGAAYDAEDVTDEFLLIKIPRVARFSGFSWTFTLIRAPQLHRIGTRIDSIKAEIGEIYNSMQMAGIRFVSEEEGSASTSQMRRRLRRTDPDEEDEHIIKLESATRDVLTQLMQLDDRFRVVSIVGMGGLGKTTLAKQIYNRIDIKEHFDCHSWAFLSQQFAPTDVLFRILKDVGRGDRTKDEKLIEALKDKLCAIRKKEDLERMGNEELAKSVNDAVKNVIKENRYLAKVENEEFIKALKDELGANQEEQLFKAVRDALKEKRYLVVLDDIWKPEAWDSLKRAFPNGKKGSKVLFTTRIKEVASYADPWSSPVEPPLLMTDEGWTLLKEKAFPQDIVANTGYTPEFEKIGKDMVTKLEGLPLAIAVLGGVLANKSLTEWERVQRDINAQFMQLQTRNQYAGVEWILALSYHELPFRLRQCFLYLSQFAEDSEFHKKRLIRMWIAEGFIAQTMEGNENETMEDVGEEYLEELVSRSMVHVSERDYTGIGIKRCRMHDLMRDMCVSKAREENFLNVIDHKGGHTADTKSYRIALHAEIALELLGQRIRSLLVLCSGYETKLTKVSCFFNLLRVLYIHMPLKSDTDMAIKEIGKLVHLRCLGLRLRVRTAFMDTPIATYLRNLKSLCALELSNFLLDDMPGVMWKLECLRHLIVGRVRSPKLRLGTLKQLQTLKLVGAEVLIRNDALPKLTNLRDLGIEFSGIKEAEAVLESPIFYSGNLRSLKMQCPSRSSFPNLKPLSACHNLTKLFLRGAIAGEENQNNLKFLPGSLTKLSLEFSGLKKDPMGILEKLPNLRILTLSKGTYEGSEMSCSSHGFPKLETLTLDELYNLKEWRVEEGAMPCLRNLHLRWLRELEMIPDGVKFLDKRVNLKQDGMPIISGVGIEVIKGSDSWKGNLMASITVE